MWEIIFQLGIWYLGCNLYFFYCFVTDLFSDWFQEFLLMLFCHA